MSEFKTGAHLRFPLLRLAGSLPFHVNSVSGCSFSIKKGFLIQLIQNPLDYSTRIHHTNMDVYDHLLIEDLMLSAVVMAAFVDQTAMREDMLPREPLPDPLKYPVRRLQAADSERRLTARCRTRLHFTIGMRGRPWVFRSLIMQLWEST